MTIQDFFSIMRDAVKNSLGDKRLNGFAVLDQPQLELLTTNLNQIKNNKNWFFRNNNTFAKSLPILVFSTDDWTSNGSTTEYRLSAYILTAKDDTSHDKESHSNREARYSGLLSNILVQGLQYRKITAGYVSPEYIIANPGETGARISGWDTSSLTMFPARVGQLLTGIQCRFKIRVDSCTEKPLFKLDGQEVLTPCPFC